MQVRSIKRGSVLVEVIIGAAIISVFSIAIIKVFSGATMLTSRSTHDTQAAYLVEEGVEALRSLRDFGWTNYINPLSTGVTYYLTYSTTTNRWLATTTNTLVDNYFERKFTVENVYRNDSKDIASSGTLDPNSKLFTISVSWRQGSATTTKSVETYFANILNN